MANLDSLHQTIEELESTSKQIKSIRETLSEIERLYEKIKKTSEQQKELNDASKKIEDSFSTTMAKTFQKLDDARETQATLHNDYVEQLKDLSKIQKQINAEVLDHVQAISSENSKLYLDQKKHVENQLGLNFGEAQNERMKTKAEIMEAVKSLEGKVKEIDKSIGGMLEEQKKTSKMNRILLFVLISLGVANAFISLFAG